MGQVQIRGAGGLLGVGPAALARWRGAAFLPVFRSTGAAESAGDGGHPGKDPRRGQVRVMLTEDTDGERQLAQDTELDLQRRNGLAGGLLPQNRDGLDRRRERGGHRGDPGRIRPTGARWWICQGGDRAEVRAGSDRGGNGLTGLTADHVTVAKWQLIIWRRKKPMSGRGKRNAVVATMAVLV